MEKKCKKCGESKPLSDYYKHAQMGDGHLNICKDCTKKRVGSYETELRKDPKFVEKERKRGREKYHRLGYRVNANRSRTPEKQNLGRKKYPEKYRANTKSQHIKTPSGFHKHHWNYNEGFEKDVIFLTPSEHYKLHRYMMYDQERMMYRRLSGVLIDTRRECEKLIHCIKDLD